MAINPDKIKESPEEKFNRLVETVKQATGIENLKQQLDEQAKTLDRVIHETGNTNTQLAQVTEALNNVINKLNGAATQEQTTVQTQQLNIPMNSLPPEAKAKLLSEFLGPLVEAYKTYKGANIPAPSGPDFKEMAADWLMRMMQAQLDTIATNTYGIRLQPPKNIINATERIGNVPRHGID